MVIGEEKFLEVMDRHMQTMWCCTSLLWATLAVRGIFIAHAQYAHAIFGSRLTFDLMQSRAHSHIKAETPAARHAKLFNVGPLVK